MLLLKELEKDKPCKKDVRSLLFHTFDGRRAWIDNECPPVNDILKRFSPFNSAKYVSLKQQYNFSVLLLCLFVCM